MKDEVPIHSMERPIQQEMEESSLSSLTQQELLIRQHSLSSQHTSVHGHR